MEVNASNNNATKSFLHSEVFKGTIIALQQQVSDKGCFKLFQTKQKFIIRATLLIRTHQRDPTYYFTVLIFPCNYKIIESLYESPINETMETMTSVYFFPPWRYTTHSGFVFYSPLSGFSLLAYEVT